ncbi:MAG TPA: polysaccharide deacetylase family protein [Kofleriaceae bacterium]|nr:polysaccharide deacetylase family protein [Kofleriaceae bacterium]
MAGLLHPSFGGMNKRTLLADLCDRTGATELALAVRKRATLPWLPVVTFHRIANVSRQYPFDEEVVEATPAQFERQLAIVRQHFTPVTTADVVKALDGQPLPANAVFVTFDDGYLDNHAVALPLLQKYGVKATFFIATDYVTRRRLFWWDRIAFAVKAAARPKLALSYPRPMVLEVGTPALRRAATKTLLRLVKSTYELDLERFLDELTAAAEVAWNTDVERELADGLLMTWDHVRALKAAGMDVQSHTCTHRVLQTLSSEHALAELVDSRAALERELGERIFAVSYPVGHTINDRIDVRKAVARAGYRVGFTNATGVQPMWDVDRYNFKRISLPPQLPDSLFRAMLTLPMVFE